MSEPILFLDRDGALWTTTGDGLAVWNQTLHQWITSRRTDQEIELDHGPLERIPLPASDPTAGRINP